MEQLYELLHGLILKISGIWENNNSIGISFKIISVNKFIAFKNASKLMKFTRCDAVKLEGGKKMAKIIKYLVEKGIPVMGHVGLLPQTSTNYKVKGKNLLKF